MVSDYYKSDFSVYFDHKAQDGNEDHIGVLFKL